MFDAIKKRIAEIESAGAQAIPRAAVRVGEQFRSDARTRRGNVPTSIDVHATNEGISVSADDWVMKRADPKAYADILAEKVRAEVKR